MIIQCWVAIKDAPKTEVVDGMTPDEITTAEGGLTSAELNMLWQVRAEQYHETGLSHDGLRLIHCLIDPDVAQMVSDFLASRGQEPEIVKATHQDGSRYEGLPDNADLFDSFFPMVPQIDDGVPRTKPIYDDNGEPSGEMAPVTVKKKGHSFGGWVI